MALSQDIFNFTIGSLDRLLSELIIYSESKLDRANHQTLKHHAEDMVGAGTKILKILESKVPEETYNVSSKLDSRKEQTNGILRHDASDSSS